VYNNKKAFAKIWGVDKMLTSNTIITQAASRKPQAASRKPQAASRKPINPLFAMP